MNINLYLEKWNLSDPIEIAQTRTSRVYKVQNKGQSVVLKISSAENSDEAHSARVLEHYDGKGAIRVLQHDKVALLLTYAEGPTLYDLKDDQLATNIIVDTIRSLHSARILPDIKSMRENFKSLFTYTKQNSEDDLLNSGALIAEKLIASEKNRVLLHGDIHHKNILKSADGWVAIDPKGIIGESTYDLANVFYNPDDQPVLVENVNRIGMLAEVFSEKLGIDKQRILEFAFAYGCLSAVWAMEDGLNPSRRLRITKLIRELL
jgi:streptomycin 6-kinase